VLLPKIGVSRSYFYVSESDIISNDQAIEVFDPNAFYRGERACQDYEFAALSRCIAIRIGAEAGLHALRLTF
jgi:hypothetical protein